MSDRAAQHFQPVEDGAPIPKVISVTLSITLKDHGQLDFSFPANELLSYGLLEKARAKLDELALLTKVQSAQASRGGMKGFLHRMNGG